jgi:carbon monoxide dehydrogenase subunit G
LRDQAGQTETVGSLAAQGPGEGDARVKNGVLVEQEGRAGRNLLVVVMQRAVGVSARRTGKGFSVLDIEVVPAPAEEGRRARINKEVEARVGLVIGEIGLGNIDQVIGEAS